MSQLDPKTTPRDIATEEALWASPDWLCPHCRTENLAVRELCRSCGYDSNAGETPYYNPMPPYEGRPW
jgi:hypothetical protein